MSNLFIVKSSAAHTPGPQPNTIVESQKMQLSAISVTTLDYALHAVSDTESESQKMQLSNITITALTYA